MSALTNLKRAREGVRCADLPRMTDQDFASVNATLAQRGQAAALEAAGFRFCVHHVPSSSIVFMAPDGSGGQVRVGVRPDGSDYR